MRPSSICLAVFLILVTANAFAVGPVDPEQCSVTTRASQPVSILLCPDFDGTRLSRAYTGDGGTADAAIEVVIRDVEGEPVYLVPRQDLYLASPDLEFCYWTNAADAPTNRDGETIFVEPRMAWGVMREPSLRVYYGTTPLGDGPIPWLRANSVDLSGNGVVDLADASRFAVIYHGDYDYAGDFNWDGVMNVGDVSILARHVGHRCYD